jgi:hypothetical protein
VRHNEAMGPEPAHPAEDRGRRRAVAIARSMLAGELAPHEGARAITEEVWAPLRLPELAGFVAAADEWHTCPELRDALANDALRGARELVERWGGDGPEGARSRAEP